jgi:hypothetical protein
VSSANRMPSAEATSSHLTRSAMHEIVVTIVRRHTDGFGKEEDR